MRKTFLFIPFLVGLFFIAGCGGGVEEQSPTTPNANAGMDQIVFVNLQCQLDGSLSIGNLAAYQWKVKTIPSGTVPSIVSGNSRKAYFTPTAVGTYELELELSNALGVSTDEVKYSVVAFSAPTAEAGFYGVCAHLQSHDDVIPAQMIKDIGANFVRFDFDWADIEPRDDEFVFSKYDQIINKLQSQNIKVLGILDYGNSWSNPTSGDTEEINRFADYVYNTVKHFKADVKTWQVWNEPNNEVFWLGPNASNYVKLLKSAYGAVKQADPLAVVVLGGLVGDGVNEVYFPEYNVRFAVANFLPNIYINGGKDYFDVAAIHPYTSATDVGSTASIEAAIDLARSVMSSNGDTGKELWITELGPLFFPPIVMPPLSNRGYSDTEIAGWLNLIYTNLKNKCAKLFWYEFRDYPGATTIQNPNWEGLVRSDLSTKEAYAAYKDLVK